MDKIFGDCSIPQEKSNVDINEELELYEASGEEDASNTQLNSSQSRQKQLIDLTCSVFAKMCVLEMTIRMAVRSFVRFLDEKKSSSSTARYGSQALLTLKSRSQSPRASSRYRDEYRGYRRRSRSRSRDKYYGRDRDRYRSRTRSRSRSPDYHRRHRRARYDDDYDDERSPRQAGLLHVGVGHLLEAEALKEEEMRKHQHHHPIPMVELIPKALCSVLIPISTTYQIVKCIKNFVHQTEATVLMALLQPAPETFDLFDDLVVLSEGHVVYEGPQEQVLELFESLDFQKPLRQGTADFLEEHMKSFPDRGVHDLLSENDIQIFRTPEGMLSTEQGVYIAQSVASNNLKQAKGHFKTFENNDNMENGNSNFGRRDTGGKERSVVGKKDAGKPTKKPSKIHLKRRHVSCSLMRCNLMRKTTNRVNSFGI
ncbi:unnamed protein product [Lactuca virosa]|uniref:Uncharacterized protein n=1 Tax=Lactuca virosa TaxID=75947 RepID=A0AAU9PW47_9ASTR|nr:unnamed protein product [Lactuca virosa]